MWAPNSREASVLVAAEVSMVNAKRYPLKSEAHGYFSATVSEARAGMFYRFALETGEFPDPASRFQPQGPHGPSQIIDPEQFSWSDESWAGVAQQGHVIYELHIGTFTKEGTWKSAMERLPTLADLGVTLLEVMPVAEFPGTFGWGYDGVNMFAPTRLYGEPDDFRRFIDRAHGLGIGVILDVVYNHFGPDGCYLREFTPDYFSTRYENEWGDPLNFDGSNSAPVREFFTANGAYWIEEFHLDGLRLDATQQIFDASPTHIIADIATAARSAAGKRGIFLVGENEPQDSRLMRPLDDGGYGLDALWNDDFHHSAMVALTGQSEAYFTDYRGAPQEFISAAKWGFLYQGQRYRWQKKPRGTPALQCEGWQFVQFLENHDQVANSFRGARVHELSSRAQVRALTGLMFLTPGTPMLFQGQEFLSSGPFCYFADHKEELARLVAEGRQQFMSQFPSIAAAVSSEALPLPSDSKTFGRSKLDWTELEREPNRQAWEMHRSLIHLRREDPVFSQLSRGMFDAAVLCENAMVFRYFSEEHGDRLLVVNLGPLLRLDPAPEPLLAPPADCDWKLCWSSEDPQFGGGGTQPLNWREENWIIPAKSAVLFTEETEHERSPGAKD